MTSRARLLGLGALALLASGAIASSVGVTACSSDPDPSSSDGGDDAPIVKFCGNVPAAVVALADAIDELYWRSIDRPKKAHWLAAYDLVRGTLTPNPASAWARGLPDEILAGAPKGYTDAVMDDEFPLSMFFEALDKKMKPVIESTAGITGA